MLYISSRNKTDSFTAHRALCEDQTPDGGQFIPYQIPEINGHLLEQMHHASFGENVAQVLNLFFSSKLTGWDVDCCIGRQPVRLMQMSHRLINAECYHNPRSSYSYMESSLYKQLCKGTTAGFVPSWARIAIRIAVLFAVYALILTDAQDPLDIAVTSGDFSDPIAAWYARKMGLPIRTIICCCNENSGIWDLIQRGEFYTGAAPVQLERLIYHTLGYDESRKYDMVCKSKGIFRVDDENFSYLSDGFAASVIGSERITNTIRSVYRTNQYFISPSTAVIYGGIQDYRAHSGESRCTLVLSDQSPLLHKNEVAAACGISQADLLNALK